MKILVLCQYYAPEPFRLPDICQALAEQGHDVTVVTGTPNYPEGRIYPGYEKGQHRDETVNGVKVHRCPLIPRKSGVFYRFLNYYSFVLSSEWYLWTCREDFDVVLINQLSPVMMAQAGQSWARRHGKRCVLYCLDLWPESLLAGGISPHSPVYRFFWKVSRRIYRRSDAILVTSRGFEAYFRDVLGVEDRPITYLPQYAEELFDRLPQAEKTDEKVHFLFAGNVGAAQSVQTIVEAAALLREEKGIHIHIVGGGVSLESCREMARDLPNITFHGRQPLEKMPEYYAMADVLLITLVDDPVMSLTLPGKVQTYLAAGKPLVGAIGGETARVIDDARCGLRGPAQDPASLAENIRRAASDADLRRTWGENARAYYESSFRKEYFMQTLIRVLRQNCD
ncbi:MAG: glycosyltransferase family 4 protein [Eubacteriales bacterium]|nr:glycosyltransferase family 4 protein [Eubacteriales bacterium]